MAVRLRAEPAWQCVPGQSPGTRDEHKKRKVDEETPEADE
jgi:hypothetical protein